MLTMKRIVLALVAITLTCLVPTLVFGQDSVLSIRESGAYNVGYYVNANMGFPQAGLHIGNPGSTGGFGSGDPTTVAGARPAVGGMLQLPNHSQRHAGIQSQRPHHQSTDGDRSPLRSDQDCLVIRWRGSRCWVAPDGGHQPFRTEILRCRVRLLA